MASEPPARSSLSPGLSAACRLFNQALDHIDNARDAAMFAAIIRVAMPEQFDVSVELAEHISGAKASRR